MADKCLAKPSWSFFLLIGFYMRRINYDSATVNNPVFIEQRNISFQNNISLKTMRLGDLSWENCETHGRIVSLDQFGSRRAITDLFVMFIAWARKKASNVHKPPSKLAIVLISNIQSPLIVQWKVQNHNMKSSGHMHAQNFLIAERERSIYDSCRFDIGRFRAEQTNYERRLHLLTH